MKTFNLWMEGYGVTSISTPASFLGTFKANSFKEACDIWASTVNQKEHYKRTGDIASYCGCRIFDNETDARNSLIN